MLRVEHAEPNASDPPPGRDHYVRACSAFAVRGLGTLPGVWLVTAEHCAFTPRIRYLSPSGWGHSFASVEFTDARRDLALLQPDNPGELVPYWVGAVPQNGERVRSVSAVYGGQSLGQLDAHLSGQFFETTQTIVLGWSGSPVVDSSGHAFAFVSKCNLAYDKVPAGECAPGHTIVSVLQ